ncbi:magnesium/cobalt transporter CorA [Odoribacter sp. Z80]|uniref:magnesium/cobalt transporter CorA n=1 Tax=Odoribacter sp. Z80 TaxID=2304575 RepID=UPI00137A9443|nr:magnesium and cobalt transport protein CorA [Odoribacter sp. Z80]
MARFLKNKQKSQGAPPGSLIFIGKQKIEYTHIRVTQYNTDYIKEGNLKSLDKISEYLSDNHLTWVSIQGLHDTQLIGQLGKKFGISSLILEDILNTDERPKFIEDDKHLFIILKSLNFDKNISKIHIDQISLIVGKNYLITIQETTEDYFKEVDQRLYAGQGKIRTYPSDYLCYALIDTLVDNYILNIEKMGNVIEEQEKLLLHSDKELIENIYHYKTELAYIRKNIRPAKELMTRFVTSDSELINERTYNYLRDLEGLVTQALEAIEIYYTMLSDQQNSYNATISNNVNDVMKILTVFSAVFIPLTFIVGVYGMNFKYIPFLNYHYGYFILWGIMLIVTILMLIFFKRKRWF